MSKKRIQIPANVLTEIEGIASDISKKQLKDFTEENRILSVYGQNPKMQPRECAEISNRMYGITKTGRNIISIFRSCRLGIISERERLFEIAGQLSGEVLRCICGDKDAIANLEQISAKLDQHVQLRRLTLIYLYATAEQLHKSPSYDHIMRMKKDFAGECLDAILTLAKIEYSFSLELSKKKTIEEYERELFRLESNLNRVNRMLVRLQDDFEDRLDESRVETQASLMSMLNSSKYGYILDMLVQAQRGFKQLRAQKTDVPFEINTTPTLVRKLIQFVEDCGITQILTVGEEMDVSATDIEGYTFEGTPFSHDGEIKRIVVVSSGWEIKDKDIVISNPVIREVDA